MAIDNKPIKYIRYAIGEIVLVVIGILIALQINTWNEERKLKKLEKSYYKSLLGDLKKDALEYKSKIRIAKINIKKLNNIINFIDNDYNIKKTKIDSIGWGSFMYTDTLALIQSVSQAGFLQFPQIFENTITDLRSTGNIKLLQNKELKDSIVNYYNFQKTYESWQESFTPARTNIESCVHGILNKEARVGYTLEGGLTMEKIKYKEFLENIRTNPELKELAIGMYHVQHRIIFQNKQRLDYLDSLMEQVNKEF